MTESILQRHLADEFRKHGASLLRIETITENGVPDCVVARGGRELWLELKIWPNKPSPYQVAWAVRETERNTQILFYFPDEKKVASFPAPYNLEHITDKNKTKTSLVVAVSLLCQQYFS